MFDICNMLCFLQTLLYIEDWIGLRTLDEAGKVKFISVPGGHLKITVNEMREYIVPYLKKNQTATLFAEPKIVESSSHGFSSSLLSFPSEMVGLNEDLLLLRIVG